MQPLFFAYKDQKIQPEWQESVRNHNRMTNISVNNRIRRRERNFRLCLLFSSESLQRPRGLKE